MTPVPIVHRLSSPAGIEATVSNYGGTLLSLWVPDRHGVRRDVVLGFDTLDEYIKAQSRCYFGAIIGRYAGRMTSGRFTRGGRTWQLSRNENGRHHCHGGFRGLDQVTWQVQEADVNRFTLFYRSPDGEEGYPGTLDITVSYKLDGESLTLEYDAKTDAPTPVSLTNHTYFNLTGGAAGTILDHVLEINAGCFTPVDDELLPTGETQPVADSPFDFTSPKKIRRDLHARESQIRRGPGGYDHTFVVARSGTKTESLCARVLESVCGRGMEVFTTEPGVHFYTGNYLDGTITGKSGVRYERHAGFCLETQQFPDGPNQLRFPDPFVLPGMPYRSQTRFRFFTNL